MADLWLDLSKYNGTPDFVRMKNGGVKGVVYNTEDPNVRAHCASAFAAGLQIGLYQWFHAGQTPQQAADEAHGIRDMLAAAGVPVELIALDHEEGNPDQGPRALQALTDLAAGSHGERVWLYTGSWFIQQAYTTRPQGLANYGLWLAAYQNQIPAPPAPWTSLAAWQFTSTGQPAGTTGNTDEDWVYQTFSGEIHVAGLTDCIGLFPTPSGKGYYLVESDGGLWPFGDAQAFRDGSGNANVVGRAANPIVGFGVTPTGQGYWFCEKNGGVWPFGDAGGYGSAANA